MGLIKGTLAFFVGFSLIVSLFLLNFSFTVSKSLEYENVRFEIDNIINDTINEIGKVAFIKEICGSNFSSCELSLDDGSNIEYFVDEAVEIVYYKDYDCEGLNCFADNPLSVISEKSMNYWSSQFYFFFGISFLIFMIFFILVNKKENSLIYLSIFLILTAIPLLALSSIFSYVFGSFLKFMGFTGDTSIPSEILTRMSLLPFSQASSVFWIMLTITLILALIGFGIKSFKFGHFIGELIPSKKESSKN